MHSEARVAQSLGVALPAPRVLRAPLPPEQPRVSLRPWGPRRKERAQRCGGPWVQPAVQPPALRGGGHVPPLGRALSPVQSVGFGFLAVRESWAVALKEASSAFAQKKTMKRVFCGTWVR